MEISEEREKLEEFFADIRKTLQPYLSARKFTLSNSQLYAFLLASPAILAIASDGNLDMSETTMLLDIAAFFEKDILKSDFDKLKKVENAMTDEDFKKMIYSEMRLLCYTIINYEDDFVGALKILIKMDKELSTKDSKFSVEKSIQKTMRTVIYNNLGPDNIEEKKLERLWKKLDFKNSFVPQDRVA